MIVIKRSQLNEILKTQDYITICESVNKKQVTPYDKKYDIFLCHSTNDFEEIRALKAYFLKQGKSTYVAEIDDPDLNSNKVDYTTARILQMRMLRSDELYYVLSKNSQISTWMPWELGYFNGMKDPSKIQVLPIIEESQSEILNFKGHEYLELYSKDGTTFEYLKRLNLIERTML